MKVPRTNKIYSCSLEDGFSEFQKDDAVQIIHVPGGTDTSWWGGYIVGLHGKKKDKAASVWAIDVDDIILD